MFAITSVSTKSFSSWTVHNCFHTDRSTSYRYIFGMLLSPQVPPTRSRRSRSLVPGQLITLLQSESAPSLSSIALDLHVVSSNKVHRSSSDLPSNHLQDVRENEAAAVARNVQPSTPSKVSQVPGAWELQDTWEWYEKLPWLAGMNYLPRTAVNFVEMWDESTFDPQVIEEELRWAADKLGYNTLRTNLPMVLYEHDATGLTKRVNKFLRIAARCGFVVALVPLDDCEFSGRNPQAGKQPEPIPNLHNSQAIGSPGRKITSDPSQWFRVEEYIRYVVRTWGQDPRVFLLDLYNEPGNPWVFSPEGTIVVDNVEHYEICALQLMERVFTWAREEKPRQPLTVSAWHSKYPKRVQVFLTFLAAFSFVVKCQTHFLLELIELCRCRILLIKELWNCRM